MFNRRLYVAIVAVSLGSLPEIALAQRAAAKPFLSQGLLENDRKRFEGQK